MRVISKKQIRNYIENNVQAKLPLSEWYIIMSGVKAKNINELKATFNSVDTVHGYTVFNIGGNSYRLIAAIHYNTQHCYIRKVWTHAEYSKPHNQMKLKRGEL